MKQIEDEIEIGLQDDIDECFETDRALGSLSPRLSYKVF